MNKSIRTNAASIVLSIIGAALACTLATCVACAGFLATIRPALAGGAARLSAQPSAEQVKRNQPMSLLSIAGRLPCFALCRRYDRPSDGQKWERPMGYLISGTNLIGKITLRRSSSVGAVKKAEELMADGYREVQITAPNGGLFGQGDFNKLAGASDHRLVREELMR